MNVCVEDFISIFARHSGSSLVAFLPELEDGSFIASLPLLHQNWRQRVNIPTTKDLSLHQFSCKSSWHSAENTNKTLKVMQSFQSPLGSLCKWRLLLFLLLMWLQIFSINWGKVVALITIHCPFSSMNVHDLAYLSWQQVVLPASNFYTGPVDRVTCVLSVFGHSRFEITGLRSVKQFCSLIKTRLRITANVTDDGIRVGFESSACLSRICWWWRIFLCI